VGSESGQDGFESRAEDLVCGAGEGAGLGVEASDVGRHGENTIAGADLAKGVSQEIRELLRRYFIVYAAECAIQSHAHNFKPLVERLMVLVMQFLCEYAGGRKAEK